MLRILAKVILLLVVEALLMLVFPVNLVKGQNGLLRRRFLK